MSFCLDCLLSHSDTGFRIYVKKLVILASRTSSKALSASSSGSSKLKQEFWSQCHILLFWRLFFGHLGFGLLGPCIAWALCEQWPTKAKKRILVPMSYIALLDSYFWYLVLLVFGFIGIWSYWYSILLVFGRIGIWSYWYLVLLGGFSKEKHKFHGVGNPPGAIFGKKSNLQNQGCHFLKIACYPILISDSESTKKTG